MGRKIHYKYLAAYKEMLAELSGDVLLATINSWLSPEVACLWNKDCKCLVAFVCGAKPLFQNICVLSCNVKKKNTSRYFLITTKALESSLDFGMIYKMKQGVEGRERQENQIMLTYVLTLQVAASRSEEKKRV